MGSCDGEGLMAGERGVAATGLGAGQGVEGVLLGWGRIQGDWQQGDKWAVEPLGGEEARLDGP